MLANYLQAIQDWLDLFGSHPSLWGIDIINEPECHLGWDNHVYKDAQNNKYYCWHPLNKREYPDNYLAEPFDGDGVYQNHRLRDFLADAYDVINDWNVAHQYERNPLKVVCDINNGLCMSPKCYIDMAHPWDTTNPTEIRKVCDVFGLHWYQMLLDSNFGPIQNPTSATKPLYTWIWSSDRLQAFTSDECNPISWHQEVCPQTIWMADKPIIITETQRYDDSDYDIDLEPSNGFWYSEYLQYGETRHIESFVFWSGDGGLHHLVNGIGADPENPDKDWWNWGWLNPYTLGNGGSAIKDYGSN